MLLKVATSWKSLLVKIVVCFAIGSAIFPFVSYSADMLIEGATGEHKHHLKILEGPGCLYTSSFRPDVHSDVPIVPVKHPLPAIPIPVIPNDFLVPGGVIMDPDERRTIDDTTNNFWRVHGQLTWEIEGVTYMGCAGLISPWHVMTSGRNAYDPVKKRWAQNVLFHPGRNGETVLFPPVSCVKKAVLSGWANGDNASDLAILELSKGVGTSLGWNGLLCGEDAFLKAVDPINLTAYPADKPAGTMCTTISVGHDVYDNQLSYLLSAGQGMSGANPWAVDLKFSKGPYSLGVHTCGVRVEGKGVVNLATRITRSRLESIVNVVNNVF